MNDNGTVQSVEVRASERNTIAKLAIAFYSEKPKHLERPEALVQLTNPIGQTHVFYVSADDKPRFISQLRAAIAAWERAP